jgi:hypothetical protein
MATAIAIDMTAARRLGREAALWISEGIFQKEGTQIRYGSPLFF